MGFLSNIFRFLDRSEPRFQMKTLQSTNEIIVIIKNKPKQNKIIKALINEKALVQ